MSATTHQSTWIWLYPFAVIIGVLLALRQGRPWTNAASDVAHLIAGALLGCISSVLIGVPTQVIVSNFEESARDPVKGFVRTTIIVAILIVPMFLWVPVAVGDWYFYWRHVGAVPVAIDEWGLFWRYAYVPPSVHAPSLPRPTLPMAAPVSEVHVAPKGILISSSALRVMAVATIVTAAVLPFATASVERVRSARPSIVIVPAADLGEKPFAVSSTEITQEQYRQLMGGDVDGLFSVDSSLPVDFITPNEMRNYCDALSLMEHLEPCYRESDAERLQKSSTWRDECGYRLPTPEEWAFVARAGMSAWPGGDSKVLNMAWFRDNTDGSGARRVGSKDPNEWELYDVFGNVAEVAERDDADHPFLVVGGSWQDNASAVADPSAGVYILPSERMRDVGFRIVRSVPP
ncbi:formylglycine-generating enzyme family protein [Sorangium sp. So ce861]|uniref:formylglycine-generating enzyme family protein n=1 Tax=Sorangium sp. So ce861 TaxID=3133323 RepID=UPI003F62CC9D